MANGYKINWSKKALKELSETYAYLESEWSKKEMKRLSLKLDKILLLLSQNPNLFQKTNRENTRRALVFKQNSLFYHINERRSQVTVLSFFNNYKSPKE